MKETSQNNSLMDDIRRANYKWFSPENMAFFGDKEYRSARGKKTRRAYLFQLSHCWSDMLGCKKEYRWRVHGIKDFNLIDELFEVQLADWTAVEVWLKDN